MSVLHKLRQLDYRYGWIIAGIFSVGLRQYWASNPVSCEEWYGRGVFLGVRYLFDMTLTRSPIPLIYIFVIGLLSYTLYRALRRWFYDTVPLPPFVWLYNKVLNILSTVSIIVVSFLWLWGYNYCRPSLSEKIAILPEEELPLKSIKQEAYDILYKTTQARRAIESAREDAPLRIKYDIIVIENDVRVHLTNVLREMGYPTVGRVRVRNIQPNGVLLRSNASGIYIPFVGEGHIDNGLNITQVPFTIAHEMSHGYGFADEGTCNFLAYLACERSKIPLVRYSGLLSYWRYVRAALQKKSVSEYLSLRGATPRGVFEDLNAIKEDMHQFPDWSPRLKAMTYDDFLKSQGVQGGIESYQRIVQLVIAWREKKKNEQIKN